MQHSSVTFPPALPPSQPGLGSSWYPTPTYVMMVVVEVSTAAGNSGCRLPSATIHAGVSITPILQRQNWKEELAQSNQVVHGRTIIQSRLGPRTHACPEPFCYADTGTQGSDLKPWHPNFFPYYFQHIKMNDSYTENPILMSRPRLIHFFSCQMHRTTIWAQHNGKPVRTTAPAQMTSSRTPVGEDVHACVSLKVKAVNIMISFAFIKEE